MNYGVFSTIKLKFSKLFIFSVLETLVSRNKRVSLASEILLNLAHVGVFMSDHFPLENL